MMPKRLQACDFTNGYADNNKDELIYNFKGRFETLVTSPCKRPATLSPTKDCAFQLVNDMIQCTPNTAKTIRVNNTCIYAAVVRLCESSLVLGHSTFCEYKNKLANVVVNAGQSVEITFTCPSFRDAEEPGGYYSILASPLIPDRPLTNLIFTNM